jgi:hypothetical protein
MGGLRGGRLSLEITSQHGANERQQERITEKE